MSLYKLVHSWSIELISSSPRYNGSLPQGEKGRRRSKYQLMRRLAANGIKKSKHYSVKQPQTSKVTNY